MLTADEITEILKITRSDFAYLFLQAQYNFGLKIDDRREFEAVALLPDDREAFRKALNYATQKGFLNAFMQVVINSRLDKGALVKLMAEKNPGNSFLQAITNNAAGFIEPALFMEGIGHAIRCTGKVYVNNEFEGSGVLIGPTRFLTAWHVVKKMFDPTDQGGKYIYEPLKTPPSLEVEFDDFLSNVDDSFSQGKTKRIKADEIWCEMFSSCHTEELNESVSEPYEKLDGYWDYVIIRLKETPGNERRFTKLEKRAIVPTKDGKITVFQHPKASPLKFDTDKILDLDPPIPRIRFLHGVNTTDGSSGGPCFDKDFFLIGIHQGSWKIKEKNSEILKIFNVGVPILNIITHLEEKEKALAGASIAPTLEDYFLCSLPNENYAAVIGCDAFQALVMQMETLRINANTNPDKRLLLISGEKGSGKTFLLKVLSTILADAEHLKIELKGEAIAKTDAASLAKSICSIAGTTINDLIPLADYHSTPAAWVKDELVQKMVDSLSDTRKNRLVWICITDLNKFEIEGQYANDLLFHLYNQAIEKNWLRIVLDGISVEMPKTLNEIMIVHTINKAELQHVSDYVTRFLKQLKLARAKGEIMAYAAYLFSYYQTAYNNNKETAMAELSREAAAFFNQLMDKIKEN